VIARRLAAQRDAVAWIVGHPLNRGRRAAALLRWAAWRAGLALSARERPVAFVGGAVLMGGRGRTSVNAQHYAGLGDLSTMGFLLHALRPGDHLADVGANEGVMAVLAAAACGARVEAFEPGPESADRLEANVERNGLGGLVRCRRLALGEAPGRLRLASAGGAENRIDPAGDGPEADVATLDDALEGASPTVLKIDVEGFEVPVLRGASRVLADPGLAAVVIELKGRGRRAGYDEAEAFARLRGAGFRPFDYDALGRRLIPLEGDPRIPHDKVFLRDPEGMAARLSAAPRRATIWGREV